LKATRPTILIVLLLLAAVFYAIFILRASFRIRGDLYFTLIDDAMVSMRYAHHLAQGYGLTWNVSEQPVEGFTNPGWTLVMAFVHLLRMPTSKMSLPIMALSAACLLANIVVVYRVCQAISPRSRYAPLIACTITAFYFPLVFWSLRGMEVGIVTLLVDLGLLCSLRLVSGQRPQGSVLLTLIFMLALAVRLDSVLQLAVILLSVIVGMRQNLRRAGVPLAALLLTLAGIIWWQHAYFGDFLPNTFYQKVVGASVSERVRNGIVAFNEYATRDTLMLAVVSTAGIFLYKDMQNRKMAVLVGLFLVQCLYSIWVGGDYAEPEVDAANRFITQGMPFLILLFSLAADRMIADVLAARAQDLLTSRGLQAGLSIGVACAVLLVISGKPWIRWAVDNAPLLKADIRRVKVGLSVAKYSSNAATIAVHAAGQIPYYSDRRTIDLLGLNDRVIAKGPVTGPFYPGHDKWNYDYSIRQLRPDLIADNWIKLGDYMKHEADYSQLENGMYVRKDSTLLNLVGLSQPIR
jgi:hypothetical protein